MEPVKPTKEQDEIAKFLRFTCPTNTTIYQENEAHYFSGNKAVDTLLNSKYGNKSKGEPKFADRYTVFIAFSKFILEWLALITYKN